ncbi:alpha/beta fold hydrolase [Magnetospirillum aberrantis]|uniref:Alpha/beta hydrolase n=1 Tax=Magnetospirillum aberrantis SpK TaxID=908842 RepID=A0A7C9UV67_9PROT|nr:alpha/beta fold hydrolase [Magnetospirillum aberrantis]NFV79809.1 alpha/beta hydrolase [Magnetospirillum aberrantis SpK]
MALEVLRAGAPSERPPLLFIHGSFCGAWVWAEHFLPYFAAAGWHCAAVSLRGHGESPDRGALDGYGLADYVTDVAGVAAGLERPPVLIGHSLGGMVAQRAACRMACSGLAMLASVGPGGLGSAFTHMSLRYPDLLWQLGRLQTVGPDGVDYEVVRRGLFSAEFPAQDAYAYAERFQRESQAAANELLLPQWFHLMPRPAIPALVLGGSRDAFIPYGDLAMAATYWAAEMKVVDGLPHVMMLDSTWEQAATELRCWLDRRFR